MRRRRRSFRSRRRGRLGRSSRRRLLRIGYRM